MINESRIRSFLALAEQLNFSRAAEKLHVSQQALSAQVTALEADMGVSLFTRTTKLVEITPVGKELYDLFSSTGKTYHAILSRHAADNEPHLRIGSFVHLDIGGYLYEGLETLQSSSGTDNIKFKLTLKNSIDDVLEGLSRDEYEMGIIPNDYAFQKEKYLIRPLLNDTLYAYISKKHPCSQKKPRLIDLENATFFAGQRQTLAREHLDALCGEFGFTPKYFEDEPNPGVEQIMVESGYGIGLGGKTSIYYRNKDLMRIDLGVTLSIVVVWKNNSQNRIIEKYIDTLSDVFDKYFVM